MKLPNSIAQLGAAMRHLSDRQKVIAGNIANGDTPGFKARELEAPNFSAFLPAAGGTPSVARPRIEISGGMTALGATQPSAASRVIADSDTSETKPDGNNVTLEDQLLKMGQVQADFAAVTNIYRKQMGLMKIATS